MFNRFDRWSKTGKWTRLFQTLQTDPDDERHIIDSPINRSPARCGSNDVHVEALVIENHARS